jgi:hypothetical protein
MRFKKNSKESRMGVQQSEYNVLSYVGTSQPFRDLKETVSSLGSVNDFCLSICFVNQL